MWGFPIRPWRLARLCAVFALALAMLSAVSLAADSNQSSSSSDSTPTHHSLETQRASPSNHAGSKPTAKKTTTAQKTTTAHKTTAGKSSVRKPSAHASGPHSKKSSKKNAKKRGQQVIDSSRAREIQQALIREHYLEGEPSGTWDGRTQAAMQRYQEDQGWQSKTIPDSRALIKLGLGPSHDHLLNPESAMTSPADDPKSDPKQPPTSGSVPQQ